MPPPGVHLLHQSRAVCLESGDQHWPPLQSLAITGLPLPFNLGITKIKEQQGSQKSNLYTIPLTDNCNPPGENQSTVAKHNNWMQVVASLPYHNTRKNQKKSHSRFYYVAQLKINNSKCQYHALCILKACCQRTVLALVGRSDSAIITEQFIFNIRRQALQTSLAHGDCII